MCNYLEKAAGMSEKVSDWFRVAKSGDTIDDRIIDPKWIDDIVELYDPAEYTASIFEDHFSFYGNYGYVHSVKKDKDDKGRNCLYARIVPSPSLLEANKKGQLMYSSIKVKPNFANTGKAYLEHLAVTDTPASLGTERLSFSKANPNVFVCDESDPILFSETTPESPPEKPAWRKAFNILTAREDETDMKKEDMEKLFNTLSGMKNDLDQLKTEVNQGGDDGGSDDTPDLQQAYSALQSEVEQLKAQLAEDKKDDKPDEFSQKVESLETKFNDLNQQLQDALKDAGSAPPAQTGDADEGEFSVV